MSGHSNHHSPAANDPALDFTGAQRSDAASSGYADGTAGTPSKPPSPWDADSMFDYDLYIGSERPLTPGGPSTGFAQPLSVDDDPSDRLPEIGQPVVLDAPTMTQQESSTFDSVSDELMQQPMALDTPIMTQQESSPFDSITDEMIQQPMALDASTMTQQESSTYDSITDEMTQQPVASDSLPTKQQESSIYD